MALVEPSKNMAKQPEVKVVIEKIPVVDIASHYSPDPDSKQFQTKTNVDLGAVLVFVFAAAFITILIFALG